MKKKKKLLNFIKILNNIDIKNDLIYSNNNNKFMSHIFTESNYLKESYNYMQNSLLFNNRYNIYNNSDNTENNNIKLYDNKIFNNNKKSTVNLNNNKNENNDIECNKQNYYDLNKRNEYIVDSNENKNIVLYFIFENGRQLDIKVSELLIFEEVINLLSDKYSSIKEIKFKDFIFNKKKIMLNKTVKENGLEDSSVIKIVEI